MTRVARAAPRWLVALSLLSVSLVSIPLVYVVWRAVDKKSKDIVAVKKIFDVRASDHSKPSASQDSQ